MVTTATDEAASALLSMQNTCTPPSSPHLTSCQQANPPKKFRLTHKRKKSACVIELVYLGDDSVTEVVVPVRPGDSKSTIFKRQKLFAVLEMERDIRLTAYCVWNQSLVSIRFNPAVWEELAQGPTVGRFSYYDVELVVVKTSCKQMKNTPYCKACSVGEGCNHELVYKYLVPHPKVNGNHGLCDRALSDLAPIQVICDDTEGEYREHMSTVAVSS